MIFNIFLRLFKVFAGFEAAKQTTQYCRNWDNVDPNSLTNLYSWMSEKNHFIDRQQCPIACTDYQYKTQQYFNASLISPYPIASEHFSELCTIPALANYACKDY